MKWPLKILTLPDIHDPYSIDLNPVLDFADDWNPHIIQFLGDTSHAESCNHWKIKKNYLRDVTSVEEDHTNLLNNVLNPFKVCAPRSKMVYHIGNHEDWYYQAMAANDKAKGKFDLEKTLPLSKLDMTVIPLNRVVNFGHLHYMHGIYTNKYHAAKTLLAYRRCIVYGHVHDVQEHCIVSPVDDTEKMFAKSVGCLCTMNPFYMKDKPNNWVNAFHIAVVNKDGTFNENTIIITNGRFTMPESGKVYKE